MERVVAVERSRHFRSDPPGIGNVSLADLAWIVVSQVKWVRRTNHDLRILASVHLGFGHCDLTCPDVWIWRACRRRSCRRNESFSDTLEVFAHHAKVHCESYRNEE